METYNDDLQNKEVRHAKGEVSTDPDAGGTRGTRSHCDQEQTQSTESAQRSDPLNCDENASSPQRLREKDITDALKDSAMKLHCVKHRFVEVIQTERISNTPLSKARNIHVFCC